MSELTLGTVESRFADMIWSREPVSSSELVKLAASELDWKKSTTYTVLKRLIERGLFKNEGGVVTARILREEYYAQRSEHFVDESFSGSLPAFIAAFTSRKKLTEEDIAELQKLIDGMRG